MIIKVNSLVQENNFDPFVIVSLIYKVIHIFGGSDYGFIKFESHKLNIFKKIWAVIQSLIICIVPLLYIEAPEKINIYWNAYNMCQFITSVVLLIFIKDGASFFDFFNDCKEIDWKMVKNKKYFKSEWKLLRMLLLSFSFRCLLFSAYIVLGSASMIKPFIVAVIYWVQQTFQDYIMFTFAYIFCAMKCRVQYFISTLESTHSEFESMQRIYKSLIEVTEKFKRAFDALFMATLLFCIPAVMATIYFMIIWSMQDAQTEMEQRLIILLNYVYIIWTLMLVFVPAMTASSLASCSDNIILILHNKLLEDSSKDERTRYEISRFLEFVRARPFQFTVYKLVPLNEQLLGMVLQFCVTYLIVIVQFTVKM